MRIHQLTVANFRGIRSLDWTLSKRFVCLVGPGDSTKSTILDAIEYVLSPRWNIVFEDTDFFNSDSTNDIQITATVGELPDVLLTETKFGLDLRGWDDAHNSIVDEPIGDCLPVLTIRLQVDSTLEPKWTVITERSDADKTISHRDREWLHLARLGASVDWHLSWRRGSVLSRITGNGSDCIENLGGVLADATRAARSTFKPAQITLLQQAASKTHALAKSIGVLPTNEYQPHLDFQAVSVGVGGVTLHDGEIPLRRSGLGTRRLLMLALQKEAAKTGGVTLVDEVEHGLEPHRIRRLLCVLRETTEQPTAPDETSMSQARRQPLSHVFLTTHSPTALLEVKAENVGIVRCRDGVTTIRPVPATLQNVIQGAPDALLGKKIVVCEGKTELGLCRALDIAWSQSQKASFGLLGVVAVIPSTGGGSRSPKLALNIAALGFETLLLADSDRDLNPTPVSLSAAGVKVIQWADNMSIDQRAFADLPDAGLLKAIEIAISEWGLQSIRDCLADKLGIKYNDIPEEPSLWLSTFDRSRLRQALGEAAKKADWYKTTELGEQLGNVIASHLSAMGTKDLGLKLTKLRSWIDSDE